MSLSWKCHVRSTIVPRRSNVDPTNLRDQILCRRIARPRPMVMTSASSEASQLLESGRKKWDAGDRMGALNLWESALDAQPTNQQRTAALYNATAVHASFGDIELAQITLRDAVQNGLDFQRAVESPEEIDPVMVKLRASQQVLIRLKRFAETTKRASGSVAEPPPYRAQKSPREASSRLLQKDLSEVLETDMKGIDASLIGILRRVLLVLVALTGLGVLLWFVGLQSLTPPSS